MRRITKVGTGIATAAIGWVIALVIAGFAARGCVATAMQTRLAESFDAQVTIGAVELGLVRGRARLSDLVIEREHDGHLHVAVQRIDAGLAPLGAALWDRGLGTVAVRGVELSVSAWSVLRIHPPKRPPVHIDQLIVDDADLALLPLAGLPDLGRFEIHIDHARAGPMVLRTPLSWLLALQELDARLGLPGGVTVRLTYRDGQLGASGGMFGATPIEIPLTLPVAAITSTVSEGEQLLAIGKEAAERLVLARAESWIKRKVDWVRQ